VSLRAQVILEQLTPELCDAIDNAVYSDGSKQGHPPGWRLGHRSSTLERLLVARGRFLTKLGEEVREIIVSDLTNHPAEKRA
jgi:hypothetical protein